MSVFDVTKDAIENPIHAIRWCYPKEWDLVRRDTDCVYFSGIPLDNWSKSLISSKDEAEALIKALQKAIELGWVK